jgi:putative oxidoreductase
MKKLFSWKYSDTSLNLSLLIFRLALGGLMIPNGYGKLKNFGKMIEDGKKGLPMGWKDPLHMMGPEVSLSLLIFAEFFCACLIVAGLMTRLATIPLIIAMSVAVFVAHHGRIFGDGSAAAIFLFGFLALLLSGPGKISMDKLIGK